MITLEQMRERVTEKLAEVSGVFWDTSARDNAINDAVRLVSSVTKGVPVTLAPDSDPLSTHWLIQVPGTLAGIHNAYAQWFGGGDTRQLPAITTDEARMLDSRWRRQSPLPPRWVVIDEAEGIATLSPVPSYPVQLQDWRLHVHVVPDDVVDGQLLFLGVKYMRKFLTPTMLLACAYLLLQERFDNDAERFYNMALQELQILGVDSRTVPALERGLGPSQVAQ